MKNSFMDTGINGVFLVVYLFFVFYFYEQLSQWFLNLNGANNIGEITVKESLMYLLFTLCYLTLALTIATFFHLLTSGKGNALKRLAYIVDLGVILTNIVVRSVR